MFKWIWTWAVILALPLFLISPIALAETQHQLKEVGMPITLAVWNTLSTRERLLYISGLIDMSGVDIPDAKERAYLIGTILGELHGYSNSHQRPE
jgi:hypothetical protein